MEKSEVIQTKLTGAKNYAGWSFQLRHFVQGQGLTEFLDSSSTEPTQDKAKAKWIQSNSKVVNWILNSIDPSIILSLQSYSTAYDMWSHLKKIYHQTNKARKYYIDTELAKYCQGDKMVQEYYNGFLILWQEKDSMVLDTMSIAMRPEAIKLQEESHISQFLMNLRPNLSLCEQP